MNIGMMMNFKKPTQLAELTAIISKYHGIDIIYMNPKDVDVQNDYVNGRKFINGKWVRQKTDIPPFIDIAPYCFMKRYKKVTKYLKQKTFLSDDRSNVLSKKKLQEKLKQDKEYSHLVIPTLEIKELNDIISSIEKYEKIVIKPSAGIRGRNVYFLVKEGEKYVIGYQTKQKEVFYDGLKDFFEEFIQGNRYILQKYISSRTKQNDPFDCRIHVEKNGEGKWDSAKNYIRIGIGQSVISNVNQGGGISELKPFLKANFDNKWEMIYNNLNQLANTLPYKIEQMRNTHIMSLGLDIGIDKSGELYLFEINDGPATETVKSEVAMLRSKYYKYILENEFDMKVSYVNENDWEKDFYKNKYLSVTNSTSWHITKPIRKLGQLFKKY